MNKTWDSKTPDIVVKSLFSAFDTDNSGHLHGPELRKLFMQYGISEDAAKVWSMQMNDDGEGGVTVEEFIDFMKKNGSEVSAENEDKVAIMYEVVERFQQFDTDGSENINWAEFQLIMDDMKVADEAAKTQWWWYIDKNQDGKITFNEFFDGFFKQMLKDQYPEEFGAES